MTLFIAAGAATALTALYVLATRSAAHAALAGEHTVVGLHDAAAETIVGGGAEAPANVEWQLTTVNDLSAAEDLLDSLEVRGIAHRELIVLGNCRFAIRWR